MGTLYVTSVPAGNLDDLPLRALRRLKAVSFVVADEIPRAQALLGHCDVGAPLLDVAQVDAALAALDSGDGLLLLDGWSCSPSLQACAVVASALECGHSVVPVPGPTLPIAALVVSGLPADTFIYLGRLPEEVAARRDLLASLGAERRTLVALAGPHSIASLMAELYEAWGDRAVVVVTASDLKIEVAWRGTLRQSCESFRDEPLRDQTAALLVGGAREQVARWDEDRVQAEVRVRLRQGLSANEIARQLAPESGWLRREIYRLAVQAARFPLGS